MLSLASVGTVARIFRYRSRIIITSVYLSLRATSFFFYLQSFRHCTSHFALFKREKQNFLSSRAVLRLISAR